MVHPVGVEPTTQALEVLVAVRSIGCLVEKSRVELA